MSESQKAVYRVPRREFLANLLFCGTALSVAGLQSNYDLVARRDPKEEGWEMPEDRKKKAPKDDGWELPEDLLNSTPSRPPKPVPQPQGGKKPPQVRGIVKPPDLGDVSLPKKERE